MPTKPKRPGKLHRSLRLQHHKHTGRKLVHKHTSYRGLAVVLGLAGLMIVGLNMMARVTADSFSGGGDLYVYARNPAPIPSTGAVITSPSSGASTTHGSQIVSGTCPVITPRVIVVISVNGAEAGSIACDSNDTFSINVTLTPGENTLVAKTYTITDDTGPDSAPVTIRYDAVAPQPAPGPRSGSTTTGNAVSVASLVLTIDKPFIVFGPGKDAVWLGSITGGTTPYKVRINWGDGTTHIYALTNPGSQSFSHHYKSMQPHDITFRVSSADGQYITRHYAAVTPYTPPVSLLGTTPRPWNGSTPLGIYGLYLLVLAMFGVVWMRQHPFAYAKVPVHHRYYATQQRKTTRRR